MLEAIFGKSFSPDKDIPSLSGKVVLVTGGTIAPSNGSVVAAAR